MQARQVPLLFHRLDRHKLTHHIGHARLAQTTNLGVDVGGVQNVVALLVDDLALIVGDVVVFQQLLANVEVVRFHLALGGFDAARDHARFNRFALGHLEAIHDGLDPLARKNAQQRVFQAQVKTRGTRITLTARTTAQLVVDASRLVALGGNDAQATQAHHFIVILLPLLTQGLNLGRLLLSRQRRIVVNRLNALFHVTAQHDVGTSTRHVGGNGDGPFGSGLGNDVGFALVLLGVEHLMRQLRLGQQLVDQLRVLNGGGAHQHRLTALMTFANVLNRCGVFLGRGFVDAVELIFATVHPVRRNDHRFEAVNFLEFVGFGIGRTRHACQLPIQTEIVLERDGRQRLVFGLNAHTFFGFHSLMQAIAPAAPGHQTACEFVHDDDFAALHHVVLIFVEQVMRFQSRHEVMHQGDVGRLIQRSPFGQQARLLQQLFGLLVPLFGEVDLTPFFVEDEIARLNHTLTGARIGLANLLLQMRHHLVHGDIHGRVIFGLARDDQRGSGLIDQNRIHLVHDGVVQTALHPVFGLVHHVVTQVIEAEFVVGAVGDVGVVGGLLLFFGQVGQVHAHTQAQELIQLPHPARIALG